jgi:Ca2+-binding RTX toxin-like protein
MDRKIITSVRSGFASLLLASVVSVAGIGAAPVMAAPFTGGLSPTIYDLVADMNGDGVVGTTDDSNAFYGDTAIINGALDCDAWPAANDGTAGNLAIDAGDDCTLIGYDGTVDGVTIDVVNGEFATADTVAIPDGQALPAVFNAADPDNPSVLDSDFAWSTINGRVDSSGDEVIDGEDCSFDVIGTTDVLGDDVTCGFGGPVAAADNGKVDLNNDIAITAADTCLDGCFLGRDVVAGVVDDGSGCTILGTPGRDILQGTSGPDIICGRGGNDRLFGHGGTDIIEGGPGNDVMEGGLSSDILLGDSGPDTARGDRGQDRCDSAVIKRSCEL